MYRRSRRRTIVYKGLLLAPQIANFYVELSDPDVDERAVPGPSALLDEYLFPAGSWRILTGT